MNGGLRLTHVTCLGHVSWLGFVDHPWSAEHAAAERHRLAVAALGLAPQGRSLGGTDQGTAFTHCSSK
jgi:hypothetical protein